MCRALRSFTLVRFTDHVKLDPVHLANVSHMDEVELLRLKNKEANGYLTTLESTTLNQLRRNSQFDIHSFFNTVPSKSKANKLTSLPVSAFASTDVPTLPDPSTDATTKDDGAVSMRKKAGSCEGVLPDF